MKLSSGLIAAVGLVFLGAGCSSSAPAAPVYDKALETDQTPSPAAVMTRDGKGTTTIATLPSRVDISMDEAGFHPSEIHLAKGGTVVFKNTGKTDVWPASSKHPTHLDYPKFDPKKGIKPGASYEIDFSEAKTYFFHDHLSPSRFGKIVVE